MSTKPGAVPFNEIQYASAVANFLTERRSLVLSESVIDYETWRAMEASEGRERPSAAALRLLFGTWQAAKRAATSENESVMKVAIASPSVTHSAIYTQRARSQAARCLSDVLQADNEAQLKACKDAVKSMMHVLERNYRLWFRAMLEDSGGLDERVASSNEIKQAMKARFAQGGLHETLSDMNIDRMLNFKNPLSAGGWAPTETAAKSVSHVVV